MEKMNMTLVCIDDDNKIQEDAFFDEIEDEVNEIRLFTNPQKGLEYINENLGKNLVVLLDWRYNNSASQGEVVIKKIYETSTLIPVIVFTGADINASEANKMFDGHAFYCLPKGASIEKMRKAVENAYAWTQNDIRSVIERWILNQDEERREKPYMRSDNQVLTLNQILDAIRNQTELGKEMTNGILRLATELFTNNIKHGEDK